MMLMVPVTLFSSSGTTYATWNPSDKSAGITLSNGNLTATGYYSVRATISKSSNKWYYEFAINTASPADKYIGIANSSYSLSAPLGSDYAGNSCGYRTNGEIYYAGSVIVSAATYAYGDVIGVAFDCGSSTVKFYKNNSLQGTLTSGSVPSKPWYPCFHSASGSAIPCTANFGASALTYTPPSGYNAGVYT